MPNNKAIAQLIASSKNECSTPLLYKIYKEIAATNSRAIIVAIIRFMFVLFFFGLFTGADSLISIINSRKKINLVKIPTVASPAIM